MTNTIAQALLEAGADLNIQDNNGDTPIHLLFAWEEIRSLDFNDREEWIQTMINAGGDMNIKNNRGQTPVDIIHGNENSGFVSVAHITHGGNTTKH